MPRALLSICISKLASIQYGDFNTPKMLPKVWYVKWVVCCIYVCIHMLDVVCRIKNGLVVTISSYCAKSGLNLKMISHSIKPILICFLQCCIWFLIIVLSTFPILLKTMWSGCIWCYSVSNDGHDSSGSCSNAQGRNDVAVSVFILFRLFLLLNGWLLMLVLFRWILRRRQSMIWSRTTKFCKKFSIN